MCDTVLLASATCNVESDIFGYSTSGGNSD